MNERKEDHEFEGTGGGRLKSICSTWQLRFVMSDHMINQPNVLLNIASQIIKMVHGFLPADGTPTMNSAPSSHESIQFTQFTTFSL